MSYKYRQNDMSIAGVLFFVILAIAFFAGWVMNIIELCNATGFTGMVVVRIIGVFMAPLGAVLGYF